MFHLLQTMNSLQSIQSQRTLQMAFIINVVSAQGSHYVLLANYHLHAGEKEMGHKDKVTIGP